MALSLLPRSRGAILGWVLVLFVLWFAASGLRGRLMAHIDLAAGHYEIKTYGFPDEWMDEYRKLLRKRYGMELNAVAGCLVTDWLESYVAGYNGVVKQALIEKYGKDILEECYNVFRNGGKKNHPGK